MAIVNLQFEHQQAVLSFPQELLAMDYVQAFLERLRNSKVEKFETGSIYQNKVLSPEEMGQIIEYKANFEQLAPALATSLFKEHVLSLGAAAQISGLNLAEFIAHLADLDIDVVEADAQTPNELETLELWQS